MPILDFSRESLVLFCTHSWGAILLIMESKRRSLYIIDIKATTVYGAVGEVRIKRNDFNLPGLCIFYCGSG